MKEFEVSHPRILRGSCCTVTDLVMATAEDEKGTSAWYRVPVWDGNPRSWRSFQKEMSWWMASLDSDSCSKFNVAARWMLRQSGVVRARCEEYLPEELEGKKAVTVKDPQTGETLVVEEGDPFAGLRKLLASLETLNGTTELDRKGDLRSQFYLEMKRQPNERIIDFCTRFRSLCGEMKREGITIQETELGWFLRERLGLDALRKQLLETALAGRESYADVEAECLRLFRELHTADPLHRRPFEAGSPVLSRFLGQSSGSSATTFRSSVPSSASALAARLRADRSQSSAAPSSFASSRFRRPPSAASCPRQSMVTEVHDEEPEEEEEMIPDEVMQSEAVVPNLEEVLQAEVEVLASELQLAEEEGIEPDVIDELEMNVEKAAESLLTMREARHKLNEVRKDRGYGNQGKGGGKDGPKSKPSGNQVQGRKQDPKYPCWDCGQTGHWMGDAGRWIVSASWKEKAQASQDR